MTFKLYDEFKDQFRSLQATVWKNSVDKGFWSEGQNFGEKIALIHSEISESLEAKRETDAPDNMAEKPEGWGIELADAVIRIMDLCEGHKFDLIGAIEKKHAYNLTRPYMHGKKF